jgi:hypothetical protein
MNESSQRSEFQIGESEKVEILARYAVAMHLEANRKVGKISRIAMIVAVLIAVLLKSFWPLVAGIIFCVLAYFYLINSCVSFVEKHTGLSQELQATFSQHYKIDPQFAKDVDEFHRSGMVAAAYLKNN